MLELHYAAAGAGAALVALPTHLVASELMHILVDSEPSVVFAAARFANLIRETGELLGDARLEMPPVVWIVDPSARSSPPIFGGTLYESAVDLGAGLWRSGSSVLSPGRGDDPLHLYYTSGTAGQPTGVVLSHGMVLAHAAGVAAAMRLGAGDVWGHFAPVRGGAYAHRIPPLFFGHCSYAYVRKPRMYVC